MKNKLRKITVEHEKYLYLVTDKYHPGAETNTLTVKIFLSGEKQTPLIIDFLTFEHYFMGQPLKSGISLMNVVTDSLENVNINEPKYIQKLIVKGIEKGWNGKNKMEKQNGLDYLSELGYEIDSLKPK
ncbi:hypothetical protein PYS58_11395 [Chryseobacterium indologenes]|uniref:hypothetical protein n=1 Tax=Chryseobacterium TaxID=59732 RepID=UPI001623A6BF|nr:MULTISPECIES: hypothetical protein [Chryseobacterium]MDM1556832.1 hypothetical protein [Chryseobacterium indologenes]WET51725.1 hypothetical protein PYS58_11395 [Chryseobacterium indologenes]